MSQLNHYNSNFVKQKQPITLVCDSLTNAPNIGSVFRLADAFNIEKLILCGDTTLLGKRMKKTSRATEKYVTFSSETSIDNVILQLKNTHYVIALEITENSDVLDNFQLKTKLPIVLIIGNENFGISNAILKQCDAIVHINMYGNNSSMNVVQATAIALYELTKQLNKVTLN